MRSTRTQDAATSAKKRVTTKSSAETRTATFVDELVKRRLTGKPETKSDDVLVPVEVQDSGLLHTVNTLLHDETGEEAKPCRDESEKAKILTILDFPKK